MPGIPAPATVLLRVAVRAPIVAVVDVTHNTGPELDVVLPPSTGNLVFRSAIKEPVAKVCPAAIAQAISIVRWSAVRDSASSFGVGVAECVGLYSRQRTSHGMGR